MSLRDKRMPKLADKHDELATKVEKVREKGERGDMERAKIIKKSAKKK